MGFSSFSDVFFSMRVIYPIIKNVCRRSHVSAPNSDRVREIINNFFSNLVVKRGIDTSILDDFTIKLLNSNPKIQTLFVNTYILDTSLGFFSRHMEHHVKQNKSNDLSLHIHQMLGITNTTLDSGYFSRSNYFEVMYDIMSKNVQIKDYLESFKASWSPVSLFYNKKIATVEGVDQPNTDAMGGGGGDAQDIIDARENTKEPQHDKEMVARSFLEKYFPETKTGVSFPLNIDKVIERILLKPTIDSMQKFINSLIGHITQQGMHYLLSEKLKATFEGRFFESPLITKCIYFRGLNGKLSREEAQNFLQIFINDNKEFL